MVYDESKPWNGSPEKGSELQKILDEMNMSYPPNAFSLYLAVGVKPGQGTYGRFIWVTLFLGMFMLMLVCKNAGVITGANRSLRYLRRKGLTELAARELEDNDWYDDCFLTEHSLIVRKAGAAMPLDTITRVSLYGPQLVVDTSYVANIEAKFRSPAEALRMRNKIYDRLGIACEDDQDSDIE